MVVSFDELLSFEEVTDDDNELESSGNVLTGASCCNLDTFVSVVFFDILEKLNDGVEALADFWFPIFRQSACSEFTTVIIHLCLTLFTLF